MVSTTSIALSGMLAAQQQLHVCASNVANLGTPGYRRQQVSQTADAQGGVTTRIGRAPFEGDALERDVVARLQAENAYLANLAVFRTMDRIAGALLDRRA